MSHIILEKWESLKRNIEFEKDKMSSTDLLKILLKWSEDIGKLKGAENKQLYNEHLRLFHDVNFERHKFIKVWYDLSDIIIYDIMKANPSSHKEAISIVSSIIWNLIAFKTNIECRNCKEDFLRVLIDEESVIFLVCDLCNYSESISGIEIKPRNKLFAADARIVSLYNFNPCIP